MQKIKASATRRFRRTLVNVSEMDLTWSTLADFAVDIVSCSPKLWWFWLSTIQNEMHIVAKMQIFDT